MGAEPETSILKFVASPKAKMINVRLTPAVHDQFKIACDLRGVSMSSLLHQFIVRTIREERELEPKAFTIPAKNENIRHMEPDNIKDEITKERGKKTKTG